MKIHRFSRNFDDSKLFDNEPDDDGDRSQAYYSALRRNTQDILPESKKMKPIIRMRRISKH